jgi:hypothetical protein
MSVIPDEDLEEPSDNGHPGRGLLAYVLGYFSGFQGKPPVISGYRRGTLSRLWWMEGHKEGEYAAWQEEHMMPIHAPQPTPGLISSPEEMTRVRFNHLNRKMIKLRRETYAQMRLRQIREQEIARRG